MSVIDPRGFYSGVGEGDSTDPSTLTAADILALHIMKAIAVAAFRRDGDVDVPSLIWKELMASTNALSGGSNVSPWLCINLETGELARATHEGGLFGIKAAELTPEAFN
jgi:hypothetical protein